MQPEALAHRWTRAAAFTSMLATASATCCVIRPSFGALATTRAPSALCAPGLFSTTTGWPRILLRFSLSLRIRVSPPDPGATGEMILIGRLG